MSKMLAVLIGAGLFAASAQAQESGTLKTIKDTGRIMLGVRDSSIPFSYLDDKQSYQGYSIDICLKVVAALQKELKLPTLAVKMNAVNSATRIPLVMNGVVDLECGSTTNNTERQKQVAFAPTTFVTANRLVAKKSANIKTLADMKGKTIVSTYGTDSLQEIITLNKERGLGMNIMTAKDHAEAFHMVESGRAVAWAMDDILLSSMVASTKSPGDYAISTEALSVEPYGMMMRRNDPAFKKAVDDAVIGLFNSGEIYRIYAKWFSSPIPPKGVNLNVPMSAQLKAVIGKPTDSGNPAAYATVPEAQKDATQNQ